MSALSGLAAAIRGATDSETFDLAGKNASTIEHAIKDAFQEPFPLSETIRLTFVTGAGKLARQKYDEGAPKAITSNLRDLGYEEDSSGGAGTFKMQHDTGKNLKTVVVYPKVTGSLEARTNELSLDDVETESLLQEGTPQHKIAYTSMNVFGRMIQSMCPTWSQKKGCVNSIDEIKEILKGLDEKLLAGNALADSEQSFYDEVSISSLEEKQSTVREMMHKQVDDGQITAAERQQLISQVKERLEKLEKEKAEAEKQNKPKKVENLTANIAKATERREKLEKTSTRPPPLLKKQAEIHGLLKELAPLLELEASAKGRLLSIKETQSMARKEEIEEEIAALEEASRGWFETDEAFATRAQACRSAFKPPKKKAGATSSTATSTKTAWSTPASRKKPTPKPKAKGNKGGGGVFAAMMMDSDSD